jgi:16S rRNA processing protein RimM
LNSDRVVLAEIVRPRGNRGEVLAVSQTDIRGRLENLKEAWIDHDRCVEIENAWPHKEFWVLKFRGIDTIGQADELRGKDLWVPLSERARLPEGEYFRSDLIGCTVIEAGSGSAIGAVQGWQQYGGSPLMEVNVSGRDVLIPFVEAICRHVDLDRKLILVELPEGLLDL